MSSETVIELHDVGKVFPVYDKPVHRLYQMMSSRRSQRRWYREFNALSNIELSIVSGETVGIVGRNGSGKSTLLQLICGTLAPSTGSIHVRGRIAALLELGAGFNPDFTGRENVYLNGTVLGLTRSEIDQRFDDIAAFADIGDFIEQPVKSYSSGMYIRLAFAVAINVMPDILIIDEALAVGDEAFQRKCFARINAIRDEGATVLFVSHSAGTILELCDRGLLLDKGDLLMQGTPKAVISNYQKLLYAPAEKLDSIRDGIRNHIADQADEEPSLTLTDDAECEEDISTSTRVDNESFLDEEMLPQSTMRYHPRGARIDDVRIETLKGRRVNVLKHGNEYIYAYRVEFHNAAAAVRFGMMIKTVTGLEIGGAVSAPAGMSELIIRSGQVFRVRFRFKALLSTGTYFLNAGVTAFDPGGETFLDRYIDVAMFRILPDLQRTLTGIVDFEARPVVEECMLDEMPK